MYTYQTSIMFNITKHGKMIQLQSHEQFWLWWITEATFYFKDESDQEEMNPTDIH